MQIKKPPIWSTYGGLGPDLENEKVMHGRALQFKVADFSNQLRDFNRKKVYRSIPIEKENENEKQLTTRERAKEYAKSIPRVPRTIIRESAPRLETDQNSPLSVGDQLMCFIKEHRSTDRIINQIRLKYYQQT